MKKIMILLLSVLLFSLCGCQENNGDDEVDNKPVIADNSVSLEYVFSNLQLDDNRRFECCAGPFYYVLDFVCVDNKYVVFMAEEEANDMRHLYDYEVLKAEYDDKTKTYALQLAENDKIAVLHVDVSNFMDGYIAAENIFDDNKVVEYYIADIQVMNGAVDLEESYWVCYNPDAVDEEYAQPSVHFDSAGMCTIRENFYSNMGFYYGGYDYDDHGYYVTIFDSEMVNNEMNGQKISFFKTDDNTLMIDTDLCMTKAGDKFVREP